MSSPDFDALRAKYPSFGFMVSALTPGSGVALEIMAPSEEMYRFDAPTLTAALALAFADEFKTEETENVFD